MRLLKTKYYMTRYVHSNSFVFKVVTEGMIDRGKGGAIVNISSQTSHMAVSLYVSYSISKAALDQVTRTMALELGPHQVSRKLNKQGKCQYASGQGSC